MHGNLTKELVGGPWQARLADPTNRPTGPPKAKRCTWRNPAGMVIVALAMLPGVGGSSRKSWRTVPRSSLPPAAWVQLINTARTGR